jgi:nicotinate-nucleotide pyrophosphorylase (carboxylating)
MISLLPPTYIWQDFISAALREDLGRRGDITTRAIFSPDAVCQASFVAREAGLVCGGAAVECAMKFSNDKIKVDIKIADGMPVQAGDVIAVVTGPVIGVLEAERVALNVLRHLTSIATMTRKYVDAVAHTSANIVCTRKTTPLYRALEKYAVLTGGGMNHRFGLDDAVLIKDNHIAVAGDIVSAIEKIRASVGHMVKVEVEVDTLDQLQAILGQKIDAVLLDNMSLQQMTQAVDMVAGQFVTEASGGVTLDRVAQIAETGVNLISVGALTHSVKNFDIGLDILK